MARSARAGSGRRVVGVGADVRDLDLDDHVAPLASHHLAGLVGGHAHQPRTQPFRVTQRSELAPRDGPCGLDGVLGHVRVAADDVAEARHVVVVGAHDAGERVRIPGRGLRHGRRRDASR